ncbi:SAM-dependent methyltransferase [Actinomadura logoneensis]|uniref:SAM-dependent methyltransferase n=1 Tax=Actinomadura logoneensis TaxID=2293572 RepID=A0A372JF30_9ACTN|nr:SAM-dependent methyltransferase [Actinomadura logoneensis]RFU38621.1 SAM-dependent methyltransferase [Actinomadura logoneensis]
MTDGGGLGLAGPARVYDCLLGGKDNYAVDRRLVRELLAIEPGLVDAAHANRAFVRRAVRELAGLGLRQFLDIGCGLPTTDNVHQIASRHAPGTRVLYVDQDPLVLVHARALLVDDGEVAALQADLRKPDDLVAQALDHGLLDPGRPVAVLLTSVLHHLTDAEDPWHCVRTLTAALAPGSAVVVSHLTDTPVGSSPGADEPRLAPGTLTPVAAALAARYTEGCALPLVPRDASAIAGFLDGLEPLAPGVVPVDAWRPDIAPVPPSEPSLGLLGAAGLLGR